MIDTASQEDTSESQNIGAPATEQAPDLAPPAREPEAATGSRKIEFLEGIPLVASVELGRADLTIAEVLDLQPGSLVHLDKMLGDPVELIIRDNLIARGEVVVVDDKFGLRITEIPNRLASDPRE